MKKTFTLLLVTMLLAVGGSYAQSIPELLYYKFDGTGTTVPNLASAPPAGTTTATIMGSQTQGGSGQCGRALVGTGATSSTEYVNTNWATNLSGTSWTISFWTSNVPSTTSTYYILGDLNAGSLRVFTGGVAGAGNWILRGGFTDVYANGGASGAPTMTTFVYDMPANEIRSYVNGVLASTVAQTAVNISGTGPFKVGGYSSSNSLPSGSLMDEFRLYNRALSVAEIQQIMITPSTSTINVTACNSYTVPSGDETYTANGTYMDTIPNAAGCDSIMTINVTILNSSASTMNVSACNSFTVPSGDETYTTGGTYMDTIPNAIGCDSVLTINLTILNSTANTMSITACNSYTVPSGDETYTTSGTYMDTIPNAIGCDSVLTINLTILNNSTSTMSITACNSYTVPSGDETYTSSGTYMDTIPNTAGCDSIMTINLTILNSSVSTMTISACNSYTVPSGDETYTTSGTYMDTIPNTAGCDSIMTINLTILNSSVSTLTVSSCNSYTVPSGDETYTTSGTYMDTIPNAAGCDSIMTINVTIINNSSNTISITACNSYTVPSGNQIHTVSGTYLDVIPNAAGCDSVLTINLTILNSSVNTMSITACNSYTVPSGNQTYTVSGTYNDVIPNAAGCDSILTINVTILQSSASNMTATSCGSYTVPSGNQTYTASGIYTDIIPNAAGCDSVITINLTINNVNTGVTVSGVTLTATAAGAAYKWINCSNNQPIAGQTSQTFTPTANGDYAVIVTENSCTDTSNCVSITNIGVYENSFAKTLSVFPNPTNGQFTLSCGDHHEKLWIDITNAIGETVSSEVVSGTLNSFEITGSTGLYFVKITNANGEKATIKVIKQ